MTRDEDQKLKKVDVEAKVEGDSTFNTKPTSSSRQWSMFKNPRIVRVSRAFGGKDRHSKVTTIRGLRDRRIRLSVPTAIQLYDLQDRLGLSQPSKVVDWLLDAAKDDIDKLPPLQMAPGNFNHFHNPSLNLNSNALKNSFSPIFNSNLSIFKDGASQSSTTSKEGITENSNFGDEDMIGKSKAWDLESSEQNQDGGNYNPQISAQNFFPMTSHSLFPNLLNNSIPYNSFYHMQPNSNLSLSQFENQGFQNHEEGGYSSHLQSIQPTGSHLYLYPSAPTPSIFPPHPSYMGSSSENDTRHVNMFLPNPFMSSLHLHSTDNEKELNKSSNGS